MSSALSAIDPFDPGVVEEPWPFFDLLREQAPVYQLPNKAYYLVSRYADVMQAVMDTDTFSSNLVAVLMGGEQVGDTPQMLDLAGGGESASATDVLAIADPPSHTRQRRVANRAFTRRRVEGMEGRIRRLSEQLLDRFESGPVDWVSAFAQPLPMTIIIELLGLPLADQPRLQRWSEASVALLSGINTAEEMAGHGAKINQLIAYLTERHDEAYRDPGDNLLGDLVREARVDAEQFGRDEVVSMLVQLLTAGNETTASLIGSAMMLMLQDDALQQALRDEPGRIPNFIEEALRLESPFHGHFRVVTRDTELGGTALKKGDRLMLLWSSAGRDGAQFDDPTRLDLERPRPRSHLAFGYGIHHCIGASLARAEARIAFESALSRSSWIRLAPGNHFRHVPSLFTRSLQRLLIQVD